MPTVDKTTPTAEKQKSVWEILSQIEIKDNIETKEGLSYLSWAWAWTYVMKEYPNSNYTVEQFNGKPYFYDEDLGYMVSTTVTIENITRSMWLPVLDSKNKAMKNKPYKYMTKNGERLVNAATTFDINTSIMRCLAKNIAMFGLAHYLYVGSDKPVFDEDAELITVEKTTQPIKRTQTATATGATQTYTFEEQKKFYYGIAKKKFNLSPEQADELIMEKMRYKSPHLISHFDYKNEYFHLRNKTDELKKETPIDETFGDDSNPFSLEE